MRDAGHGEPGHEGGRTVERQNRREDRKEGGRKGGDRTKWRPGTKKKAKI